MFMPKTPRSPSSRVLASQLNVIVQQTNFFTRLERWKANVWAAVTPESIAESAIAARPDFALDGEVNLGEVVCAQLR